MSANRRTFLKAFVAVVASLFLPRRPKSFWFLHTPTGNLWAVEDPVSWCLENACQPILERARERLLTLDASDPQRVIRLVTRRCSLNLLELLPRQVAVHYWGQNGLGDLRPFFKQHGLARKGIEIPLIERKRESSTVLSGDEFLYGKAASWLAACFWTKWQRRYEEEQDDWTAAPDTYSGFAWEGIEPNRIPWAALKSAWRRSTPFLCLNCDRPTILTNFGNPWCGLFNRYPRFLHVCPKCRRLFEDGSIGRDDVLKWMVANLDADVLPDFDMVWGRPVEWEPALVG